jgi:hypothetical protein
MNYYNGEGVYLNYAKSLFVGKTIEQAGWDNKNFWVDIFEGPQLWMATHPIETASIKSIVDIRALENAKILDLKYSYRVISQSEDEAKTQTTIEIITDKGVANISLLNISAEPIGALLYPCDPPPRTRSIQSKA